MKTYEFVNIKLQNNAVASAHLSEHRQIICEWAQKGYSYEGYIPTKQGASGKAVEIDLIFSIEK